MTLRALWVMAAIAALALVPGANAAALATNSEGSWLEFPAVPFRAERLFDRPPQPWAPGHRGIDVATVEGADVLAPGAGVVTFSGTVVDRGVVTIAHPSGLVSSVEPVAPTVAVGDSVSTGDVIGTVQAGDWHCVTPCTHWGVRRGGDYVNPLDVLVGFGSVRLLPVN